jgi:hypothetical protein
LLNRDNGHSGNHAALFAELAREYPLWKTFALLKHNVVP